MLLLPGDPAYTDQASVKGSSTLWQWIGATQGVCNNATFGPYQVSAGSYTISVFSVLAAGSCPDYVTVYYTVDNDAPAISLTKTWCYSSQAVQTAVNCTDSVTGIASVYYALTNSLSTPGSWISIPANTAVQVTDAGTWYLHVKATDGTGNSYERIEGPYIIVAPAAMLKSAKTLKK